MKTYLTKISFAIVALLFVTGGQNSLYAQVKGEFGTASQSANRLVGAWETIVTPTDCATGEQLGPAFHGVSTYNEGGTMSEFGANPPMPYRTPAHGIWVSNGGGSSYSMKLSFMPLTPAGAPIGRMRVSQDIDLGRFSDEFTSSCSFVLSNFAGVVLSTGCSTAVAVRLTF